MAVRLLLSKTTSSARDKYAAIFDDPVPLDIIMLSRRTDPVAVDRYAPVRPLEPIASILFAVTLDAPEARNSALLAPPTPSTLMVLPWIVWFPACELRPLLLPPPLPVRVILLYDTVLLPDVRYNA